MAEKGCASCGSAAGTAAVMNMVAAPISVLFITPGPLRALQSFQSSFVFSGGDNALSETKVHLLKICGLQRS